MTRRALLAAMATALTEPLASAAQGVSLAGWYICVGDGPKGRYTNAVEVVQRGRVVGVQWSDRNGAAYSGYGLVSDDMVAVAFAAADGFVGLVLYRIKDGALVGEWPDPTGQVWTETLTRTKPVAA